MPNLAAVGSTAGKSIIAVGPTVGKSITGGFEPSVKVVNFVVGLWPSAMGVHGLDRISLRQSKPSPS